MSKHTPGPWSVGEVSHKKQRVDIDSLHADQTVGHQTWRGLARAYGCEDMPAEGTAAMLANARLIAAAPELLEALKEAHNALELFASDESPSGQIAVAAVMEARAAIAKTTGSEA